MKSELLSIGIVALTACASSGNHLPDPGPGHAEGPAVEVGQREVIAIFPRVIGSQLSWPAPRVGSRWDGGQWRLMIPLNPHWLVAAHQLEIDTSPIAPARTSTEDAVAAGHLVDCELDTHVLACGAPLKGSVAVVDGQVMFRIRDPRWKRRLQRDRPRNARLLFVRGGQHVVWEGVVDIDYR